MFVRHPHTVKRLPPRVVNRQQPSAAVGDDAVFRRTSTSDTHSCAASNDDHDSTVGTLVVTGRGVGALEEEDELDQAEAGVPAKTEPAVGEEDAPCPTASTALERCGCYCRRYFNKWRGGVSKSMPRPPVGPILYGACASFLAVLAVAGLDVLLLHVPYEAFPLLLPPLGASTMLVLSMPDSHLAQPRSLIGGTFISSVLGVCVRLALGSHLRWLAAPVGIALAEIAMFFTSTAHPPGSAAALAVCVAPELPLWHGFQFVVAILLSYTMLLLFGLILNNIPRHRRYPLFWV